MTKQFCERCCKEVDCFVVACECCGNFESDYVCGDCLKDGENYIDRNY